MGHVGAIERELLVMLKRGDAAAAVAWLVGAHGADLRTFVSRRLPKWAKPWGMEEVCQEVWADAFFHLPNYRGDGPARGWLLGVAGHKVADFLRRHERTRPLEDLVSKLVEASTLRP